MKNKLLLASKSLMGISFGDAFGESLGHWKNSDKSIRIFWQKSLQKTII